MESLVAILEKRRKIAAIVVLFFAFIAIIISFNFEVTAPTYFNPAYNMYVVYFLIVYKILELFIIYYVLFHRYLLRLKKQESYEHMSVKMKKHTKLLFFLIPQGNTIFGMIAYKFSGNVTYFLIFSLVALITLIIIKPTILKTYINLYP